MSEDDVRARLAALGPAQRTLLERRLLERRAGTRLAPIPRRTGPGPYPLSYGQELLWLLSQIFDGGVAYNAPSAFRLEGRLDLEALQRAFDLLADRHEILRTTYMLVDGRPAQVVAPHGTTRLRLVELGDRPAAEQEVELARILNEESQRRFDLEHGPVLRATVVRLGPDDHVLLVVVHHVATDGWSRGILYHELTLLYEAAVAGTTAPLDPLPLHYADYAVWQRSWVESGAVAGQLEYWRRRLAGSPARLDLPVDRPRPPVRSHGGDHLGMMLDASTRERLRTTARAADTTLFVSLLALFAALLSRWSGQDDVVVGTPFAGRDRIELEPLIGPFLNPLALRMDLSGDPTFAELLQRARATAIEAFANAAAPYELVVRAASPERDLSQTPVFQAMLVLHDPGWARRRPRFEPAGIRTTELTYEKGFAKFDLLLGASERPTGLNTTWEYSTDLFEAATVRRMMEHFRALAASATGEPERRLSRLSLLSPAERATVLRWSAPTDELPESGTAKELFEAQAARTPTATAVVHGDERVDYAELDRAANRIAARLRAEGIGPGALVGVALERSVELVSSVLGVLKAGAAYVPLDPLYPAARLAAMVADAQPRALLVSTTTRDRVPAGDATLIKVDDQSLRELPSADPPTLASGDDLAYVVYTSGSTGAPKGAMISNRSLASAFHAFERAYRLDELSCHLQMASFSFDVFTGDLLRSLLAGATLVLCPLEVLVDPPRLYELMVRERVDAAEFVPATAALLFEYVARERLSLDFMRLVIVGSEAWRTERYAEFRRLCGPHTRLLNTYGLAEATIDSTWFEAPEGADPAPGRTVPIGRPLANTRAYVLDDKGEPAPIGLPGELCIGGPAVGRGYVNRPELTAERFLPDPFSAEPDARLYRTGDLARWLPDGSLEFLGRTDRQLKVRGFRVEPGEIEAVLERDPDVHAAVVVAVGDEAGAGRASRSTFPFGVSGNAGRRVYVAGTM